MFKSYIKLQRKKGENNVLGTHFIYLSALLIGIPNLPSRLRPKQNAYIYENNHQKKAKSKRFTSKVFNHRNRVWQIRKIVFKEESFAAKLLDPRYDLLEMNSLCL